MNYPITCFFAIATAISGQVLAMDFPLSDFDIKGAKLGDSIDLKDTQFPGITCKTIGRGVEECHNPNTTIGGTSAEVNVFYMEGRIVRIVYSRIDIDTKTNVDAALSQKYGDPIISFSRMEHKGARITNVFWENSNKTQLTSARTPNLHTFYDLELVNSTFYNNEVYNNRIKGITPESVDI